MKKVHPEDYDLVIDTGTTSFEDEMGIVDRFLALYF